MTSGWPFGSIKCLLDDPPHQLGDNIDLGSYGGGMRGEVVLSL